jgi:hypothetical protein
VSFNFDPGAFIGQVGSNIGAAVNTGGQYAAGIGSVVGDDIGAFQTGINVIVNNPSLGAAAISGQPVSPAGLVSAAGGNPSGISTRPTILPDNPITQGGHTFGALLNAGIAGIGAAFGAAGATAAPGVARGAGGAASGVTNVASAGILGGVGGALQGTIGGAQAALGNAGLGGGDTTILLIGAGLLLLIIYMAA